MSHYVERLNYYAPEITTAITQTSIMLTIAMLAALLIGLPLGVILYLAQLPGTYQNKRRVTLINSYINIVRSFPFLLFVIALIPLTRLLLGSAFGTYPASFPLSLVAIALYSRLVEQVLLDVPLTVYELAESLGSSTWQFVRYFLLVEARSGLVLSFTSVMISMVSYSTVMGMIGGGGIGDFAIRYGYQRYEYDIMYTTIIIMILFVMFCQFVGTTLAKKIDKRKN
ncbi:methionine ABC transporter permease [Vagococcus intermedius]|uniref:ABC transporter permease subunit n=1 Tax=Vagococcus intermedius TaxID=2991418 RepID=A0AAF0I6R9_9ENTE|nr:ABC transporter permease subunit [Vagococcus intermedius]WEG73753.1 ABC transporter permease subunit [Vagococcus intermedius]WEG75838.1 ABC transporter permease subunit [Vagococcus intermedius]